MKTRLMTFCALSFAVLLATGGPQAQAGPDDVAAAAEALLDDPDARAKMSAMLEIKLLTLLAGRMGAEAGDAASERRGPGSPVAAVACAITTPWPTIPTSDIGSFHHSE